MSILSPLSPLTPDALRAALAMRDLTDPASGPHAIQLLVADATAALSRLWGSTVRVRRSGPIVAVEDNYDRLGYEPVAAARDGRYTRYVSETCMLRSQTSALVPPGLRQLSAGYHLDVLLVCPGMVHRRDVIDRLHTGTPHQLDLWRIRRTPLSPADLQLMIATVVTALLPSVEYRTTPAVHPYTVGGRQIDVRTADGWVEIGECGLAAPAVLESSHVAGSGLAMGLGLDRILMVRKGVPDIRLLRSADPRVATQMADLEPYRPVSAQPAVTRDLSVAVDDGDRAEDLGDRIREALGADSASVEEVAVLAWVPGSEVPPAAAARLGMQSGQHNALVRLVLRDLSRSLTAMEANLLRDRVYGAIHRGTVYQWASGAGRGLLGGGALAPGSVELVDDGLGDPASVADLDALVARPATDGCHLER